jgi:hypothetical protein
MGVVVAGAVANKPGSAGEAWVRMSWVRGFERLGLDVRFVEEVSGEIEDAAVRWFDEIAARFGIAERATLLFGGEALRGPGVPELLEVAAESTLVNISGHLALPRLMRAFRRRVMVDIDPGFTQVWHAEGLPGARVKGHDLYFTVGELIGSPDCPIPTSGIDWKPVRPPVVLEDWPFVEPGRFDHFTTIANWRAPFGAVTWKGRTYPLKHHEFRKLIELPRRAAQEFEIALDIHPGDAGDLEALRRNRWRIVDPAAVARDPDTFRAYIQSSGAEFSVAQGIYVETQSGWFSDRTTRYLASGRPALVQDTGFGRTVPLGDGLVAFRTLEEAVAGAADIVARYMEHAAAARRIAEEHFDAERVLDGFCEQAGIA